MKSQQQFIIDMAILIGIIIAIYYLKINSTSDPVSPADGVLAMLGID